MEVPSKQDLRGLAEMAAAGPWFVSDGMGEVRDRNDRFVCESCEKEPRNSAFIAAANPAAILSLLDELEALQWISVEDRLPDHDGPFMCWFGLEEPSCIQQRVCIFIHRQGIFSDGSVTHWMPLNEAPVREGNANGEG